MNLPAPKQNGNICLDNGMVVRLNREGIAVPIQYYGDSSDSAKESIRKFLSEQGVRSSPTFHDCLEWRLVCLKYSLPEDFNKYDAASYDRVRTENTFGYDHYTAFCKKAIAEGFRHPSPVEIVSGESSDVLIGLRRFIELNDKKHGFYFGIPTVMSCSVDGDVVPDSTHSISKIFETDVSHSNGEEGLRVRFAFTPELYELMYGRSMPNEAYYDCLAEHGALFAHYHLGNFTFHRLRKGNSFFMREEFELLVRVHDKDVGSFSTWMF